MIGKHPGLSRPALLSWLILAITIPPFAEADSLQTKADSEPSRQFYARTIELAWLTWQKGDVERARALLLETWPAHRSWEFDYLERQFDRPLKQFRVRAFGKPSGIRYVTFNPQGTRLAACTDHLRLMIWNLDDGEKLVDLHDETRTIDYDPTGGILASGLSASVKLRDPNTGEWVRSLSAKFGGVAGIPLRVQFSADGKTLASQDSQRGVRVYDVETGTERFHLKEHTTQQFRFHPEEEKLAVVRNRFDAEARRSKSWISLFDAKTGKKAGEVEFDLDPIDWTLDLDFSPDGKRLAACGRSGSNRAGLSLVFDVKTGRVLDKLRGHSQRATCVRFSPDGSLLATGSVDGSIILWDASDGSQLDVLRGHTGPVRSIAFHPKEVRLASGSADGSIRVWNIESVSRDVGEKRAARRLSIWGLQHLTPHGTLLYSAFKGFDRERKVHVFQLKGLGLDAREVFQPIDPEPGIAVTALAQPRNQKHLVLAMSPYSRPSEKQDAEGPKQKPRVVVLDVEASKEIKSFPLDLPPRKICLSAGDEKLFAVGAEGDNQGNRTNLELRGWQFPSGESLFAFKSEFASQVHVHALRASPDGRFVAAGVSLPGQTNEWAGAVWLFDAESGNLVAKLEEPEGYVQDLCFSPDGTQIAAAVQRNHSHDPRTRLSIWNVKEKRRTADIAAHRGEIHAVVWTGDGKRIVSAGGSEDRGGEIIFWDAKTLDHVWKLDAFSQSVKYIAFGDEECRLIAIENGGKITTFDAKQAKNGE
jgi:WD40 repeat protein